MLLLFLKEETEGKNMGKKGIEEARLSDREEKNCKKSRERREAFSGLGTGYSQKTGG